MIEPRPRLLDLYCGAGGAAVGYARAGFDVTGVDIAPQPRYPFEFIQADARHFLGGVIADDYRTGPLPWDAIHASPPCQAYSRMHGSTGPDLISVTRMLLVASGLPYVIENVPGAPLYNPVQLCGSMFGLDVRRHRLFETNWPVLVPPCTHSYQDDKKYDLYRHGEWYRSATVSVFGTGGGKAAEHWADAMGIDWMTRAALAEAIPPAYTEYIGQALLDQLARSAA